MSGKKLYQKPVLQCCGRVSERTLGGPGYCNDPGNNSHGQQGGNYGSCPKG
jgi:hypothetical protein